MLAEVEKSMDIAHDKVADVNTRLKRTLEAKGMSWERMCMVFLCMALILGLIGVRRRFFAPRARAWRLTRLPGNYPQGQHLWLARAAASWHNVHMRRTGAPSFVFFFFKASHSVHGHTGAHGAGVQRSALREAANTRNAAAACLPTIRNNKATGGRTLHMQQ